MASLIHELLGVALARWVEDYRDRLVRCEPAVRTLNVNVNGFVNHGKDVYLCTLMLLAENCPQSCEQRIASVMREAEMDVNEINRVLDRVPSHQYVRTTQDTNLWCKLFDAACMARKIDHDSRVVARTVLDQSSDAYSPTIRLFAQYLPRSELNALILQAPMSERDVIIAALEI